MSENSQVNEKVRGQIDIIEDNSFSYDDFQVVRGEFFAHVFEPSITFVDSKVYVNTACIKKITETDYAQILISKEQKKLLVRPCNEDEKDSFRWCSATSKRTPKQVTCRPLFAILCNEMGWDPDYRYRFVGKLIRSNGELLFLFDLTSPEIFLREVSDDGKIKNSRKPSYPEQWLSQFGIPAKEHASRTRLTVFEDYTVITLTDDSKKKPKKGLNADVAVEMSENDKQIVNEELPPEQSHLPYPPPSAIVLDSLNGPASPPQDILQDTDHESGPVHETDNGSTDQNKEQGYEQITLSNISS